MTQTRAALERAAQKLADKYLDEFSTEGYGERPNAFALDVAQIVAAALAQDAAGDGVKESDGGIPGHAQDQKVPEKAKSLPSALQAGSPSEPTPDVGAATVSFPRWWVEHNRDALMAMKLPSGDLGDWAFLFREMLNDKLSKPDVGAEPVAWRYQPNDGATVWGFSETKPDFSQGAYWTVQPLYLSASPASPPAVVAGREEIARLIEPRPFSEDYEPGSIGAFNAEGRKERALAKADAILALYPAPTVRDGVEADGWQPIASAPKDGRRVLLWQDSERGAFEGWWHEAIVTHDAYWTDWQDSEPDPKFWRPLPTPPVAAGSERDDAR